MTYTSEIKERLRSFFSLQNEAEEDKKDDAGDDEDLFSDEELNAAADDADTEETASEADSDETGADSDTEDEDTEPEKDYSTDSEKISELYTDTGIPEQDYSLTNESNIRLAKFKFKNAGIDPFQIMDESEKKDGVRSNDLESRLTPDELELYKEKNHILRQEFPKLAEREKKVIIFNSNIPMMYNDENGMPREISHPNDENQAINKVLEYMDRMFKEDWVDQKNAIKFLQSVKINFSEEQKIRPNLIEMRYFEESDSHIVPFNKLFVSIPQSVQQFITENQDKEEYKKSSVFRTLIDDYAGQGPGSSKTSVYPIIRDESLVEDEDTDSTVDDSEEDTGDTGEGFGADGDLEADVDSGEDTGDEDNPDENTEES